MAEVEPSAWSETDALKAIWDRSAYDRGFISNPFGGDEAARLGLERTRLLLVELGSPHTRYRIIHVAGSKGKGSTCAFASSILHAAGIRAGRYSSPQLHRFRERIAVDLQDIAPDEFGTLTQRVFAAADRVERTNPALGQITAFEISTVMALDHFAATGCEVAVVEVGLGGTFDATNVITGDVAVITRIDMEHVAILGPTLADIARNKAGIIKPGRPVVSASQSAEAMAVITETAASRQAPLSVLGRDIIMYGHWPDFSVDGEVGLVSRLHSGLIGDHQVENAALAIVAVRTVRPDISGDAVRAGVAAVSWPGRYERVAEAGKPLVILDGAHTPAAAGALARALASDTFGRPVIAVVAMLADKDPLAFLGGLAGVVDAVVVAPAPTPRTADPARVGEAAVSLHLPVTVAPDLAAALESARTAAGTDGTIVVTGSLTTVAAVRELLGLAVHDPAF